MISAQFWKGKRVLISGHTGFKGSWLTLWLENMGAIVHGISLEPETNPSLFKLANITDDIEHEILDIRDAENLKQSVHAFQPEITFHLAAQPLVRRSYKQPLLTFDTNIMGTANLLEALRYCSSTKVIVVITTDKVYENLEVSDKAYTETDHLGGHDPYSASKAAAEIVVQSYRKSFFADNGVALATARAGNVIGGGDWSEDRLIPDAIKAWDTKTTLEIRSPESVRPWQHVLDPLAGYLVLAEKMWESSNYNSAWNFGPSKQKATSVRNVIDLALSYYGKGDVHYHISQGEFHEAGLLMLDTEKTKLQLGSLCRWDLEIAIQKTMEWYKQSHNNNDIKSLCLNQIDEFLHASV